MCAREADLSEASGVATLESTGVGVGCAPERRSHSSFNGETMAGAAEPNTIAEPAGPSNVERGRHLLLSAGPKEASEASCEFRVA